MCITTGGNSLFHRKFGICTEKGGFYFVYLKNSVPSLHKSLSKTYKNISVASDRLANACREPKFLCRKHVKAY